jgi:hypothetical protein
MQWSLEILQLQLQVKGERFCDYILEGFEEYCTQTSGVRGDGRAVRNGI